MGIYIFISLGLFIVGVLLDLRHHPKRMKVYLLFAFVVLVIVSAGREYYIGSDTGNYVYFFVNERFDQSRYERGFVEYAKIIRSISNNPSVLLLCSSMICIGGVCVFIYRHSKYPLISILLYIFLQFYFGQMNLMRQYLACSMILMGYSALINNKKIISAGWILLASTFHTVALIAVVPYVIWVTCSHLIESLTPLKTLLYAIVISIFLFISYSYITRIITIILPAYSGYFTSIWSDANYSASLLNTLVQFSFLLTGVCVFRKKEYDRIERFAALMMIISCAICTLSMRMEFWSRVTSLFSIYTALLWTPLFINRVKRQSNRTLLSIAVLGMSFAYMLIILMYRPEWTRVVPYVWRS